MIGRRRKILYWDASVFIAFISGNPNGRRRADVAQAILRDVESGGFVLITSNITRVEVRKWRGGADEQALLRIRDFFDLSYINTVLLDPATADNAARFAVRYNLNTADAIHLATALAHKADELHTWDKDFDKAKDSGLGIIITEPVQPTNPAGKLALGEDV